MDLSIKINLGSFGFTDPAEQFAFLKEIGFDACDMGGLFGDDISFLPDAQIEKRFTEIRKIANDAGFRIEQTHSAFGGHPRSHCFDYNHIVQRQIASIKATHYLGSKYCVMHPIILPGRRYDLLKKEAFDLSAEIYRILIPVLEKYDVYACIENMWVRDPVHKNICSTILSHAEEMVDMCNVLGDRFKICLDVGHAVLTQDDPVEAVHICGDKLAVLHAHEVDGLDDVHTVPFSKFGKRVGKSPMMCDWHGFMQALKEENYKGALSFEVGYRGPVEIQRATAKYLAKIGRYLIDYHDNI